MSEEIKISPSILSADFSKLGEEITPQQPSYFEPKSACTWHVVSIYPPQDQMKRIGEKNSISMT